MRRSLAVVPLLVLAIGAGVWANRSHWIPFWITNDVARVLLDWRDAGLSCREPAVGMPGPMVDWGCAGAFEGVTVHAGLEADAHGVFTLLVFLPAGTDARAADRAFAHVIRATSMLRADEAELVALLKATGPTDAVMPVTSTTGIGRAVVYLDPSRPVLSLVPAASSMQLAD
jgi:hypothetical protein